MAFRVLITARAMDDISDSITFIAQDSPQAARKWKTELQSLSLSLRDYHRARYRLTADDVDLRHDN